ncbi:MAG: hypothetical protein AB8G96_16580 [Phycisphaerales bacterium]
MPSLSELKKKIKKKKQEIVAAVATNYPPQMSGQTSTDFRADTATMASDCDDILLDAYFSGITPVILNQTIGTELIDWFGALADDADAILDLPSPTTAQKQTAADSYATMSHIAGDLNTAYST